MQLSQRPALCPRCWKDGAQGRIRTSVTRRVADLQSAAINHSATCALCIPTTVPAQIHRAAGHLSSRQKALARPNRTPQGARLPPELSMANAARESTGRYPHPLHPTRPLPLAAPGIWSWRRDLNPRPPDYKSGALPAELRQPDGPKTPDRRDLPGRVLTANGARQNTRAQLSLYHKLLRGRRDPALSAKPVPPGT